MEATSWKSYMKTQPCCKEICAQSGLSAQQQFQRACAVRLCEAIVQQCNQREANCWSFRCQSKGDQNQCTLCIEYKGVVCATCDVDKCQLPSGQTSRALQHFWSDQQQVCPDICLTMCPPGQANASVMMCECCCQEDRQATVDCFRQAAMLCNEYAAQMKCSPKVAVVTCCEVQGKCDPKLDIACCNWSAWPAAEVTSSCCNEIRKNAQAAQKQQKRA